MAVDGPGATLLLRIPAKRFNLEFVELALGFLIDIEHPMPSQKEGWQTPAWRQKYVKALYESKMLFGAVTYWDPPVSGSLLGMRTVAQYFLDLRNKLALPGEDVVWVMVWVQQGNFNSTELDKAKRVTANFKRLVEVLKPTFAAVDNHGENMVKRKGKDPRRFAWGAMYYDADHVQRIGKEKLRACGALVKQDYPDGGMWVQTWGNPFIVAKEVTQLMEKELGLKEAFPEGAAAASTAKAKAKASK